MDDAKVKWEGYVRVLDINGKHAIAFRKLGAEVETVYQPSGMMENAAVNGLVKKLQ